jgi:Holliday junction resolvasome RuvABC endonuclease subunit
MAGRRLLAWDGGKIPLDASDALAVAICHLHHQPAAPAARGAKP